MKQNKLIKSAIFSIILASFLNVSTLPSFAEEIKEDNVSGNTLSDEKIKLIEDTEEEIQNPEDTIVKRKKKSKRTMEFETNYKGVGATVGLLSGAGFTYREFFADKFGYKATGIYFFDTSSSYWDVGLQGMWVVNETDWLRLYLLGGVSHFGSRRYSNYYYSESSPVLDSDNVYIPPKQTYSSGGDTYNNIGVGLGIEFWRQNNGVSLALELPLVLSFRNFQLNSFYPVPQLSLIYNF